MGMTPSRKRYQQIPTNTTNQYNQRDLHLQNQYNLTINDDTTQMGYAHGMCVAETDTYMPAHSSPHNTYHTRTTNYQTGIHHHHANGCQV